MNMSVMLEKEATRRFGLVEENGCVEDYDMSLEEWAVCVAYQVRCMDLIQMENRGAIGSDIASVRKRYGIHRRNLSKLVNNFGNFVKVK